MTVQRSNTDWLHHARWGAFTHYLGEVEQSADDWNRQVDAFDVDRLARQVADTGVGYFFITIGQNSGHYCSPNETYDRIVGIRPSKCSRRDLIADLADALAAYGIPLMVYLSSGGPAYDPVASAGLEWEWGCKGGWGSGSTEHTGDRLAAFQRKWEAVIREWSLRWGDKVKGWWIDGCYFADAMYRHDDEPNFASFAAAMKAGNPATLVAFNAGATSPIVSTTEHEDYTAGEQYGSLQVQRTLHEDPPMGRWVNGAQLHVLTPLGEHWSNGQPRMPDALPVGYTQLINGCGGVVTWDVPTGLDGSIPEPFMRQLRRIGQASATLDGRTPGEVYHGLNIQPAQPGAA